MATPIPAGTTNWDVPANANFSSLQSQATALQNNANWGPIDQGLLTWDFDPVIASGSQSLTSGVIFFNKVVLRNTTTVTNVLFTQAANGTSMTSGQNFVAVYDSSGTRHGISADLTTTFSSGGAGAKTIALTAPFSASAGYYYIAILANSTGTAPTVRTSSSLSVTMVNVGNTPQRFIQLAGQTTMPSSVSTSGLNQTAYGVWMGLT